MAWIRRLVAALDRLQQRYRVVAVVLATSKKLGDDHANQSVVALGWYGFTAIYPLLLVVVTVLGFIGAASLGKGIVSTLHEFPVVGSEFNPAHGGTAPSGSPVGLAVGLAALLYGAQGVTQTAQRAMAQVWNVPRVELPGFLPRLGRSLAALVSIGATFVVNAALGTYATATGNAPGVRVGVVAGMLAVNVVLFLTSFRLLTPKPIGTRGLVPGAALAATGFTFLVTVGTGLVQHQVRHSSAVYGQFGIVIGLVGFLLLIAKLTVWCAELNAVLARKLWPRSLRADAPTPADHEVLRAVARQERTLADQRIGVGFGDDAAEEAAADARRDPSEPPGLGPGPEAASTAPEAGSGGTPAGGSRDTAAAGEGRDGAAAGGSRDTAAAGGGRDGAATGTTAGAGTGAPAGTASEGTATDGT